MNGGRLDVAIVALPVSEPSLTEIALFTESFVLVRPHGDEGQPAPNREALREMRLLLLEEGHCFRDQALSFCNTNAHAAQSRDLLDASSLSTLVQMVDAGMGVTLIPEMAIAVETRSASVSVVRFEDLQPSRTIGMVWRKTNPLAEQFLRFPKLCASQPVSPGSRMARILRTSAILFSLMLAACDHDRPRGPVCDPNSNVGVANCQNPKPPLPCAGVTCPAS